MNILLDALTWLAVPAHWLGESGILVRATEHLGLTLLIVALAPHIATTCWAPMPIVRGHESRSFGRTTSPGLMDVPSP